MPPDDRQDSARLIDRMLRESDPLAGRVPSSVGLDSAFAHLVDTIAADHRQAARRGWMRAARPRTALAIGITLGALTTGGALAATAFVPTRTGHSPAKATVGAVGPGELLNPRGTDFHGVLEALSRQIAYPRGYSAWRQRAFSIAVPPGSWLPIPSGQIRGEFAASAFCAWIADWRRQMMHGARTAAERDAVVIEGALRWPAVRAWDPHPRAAARGANGSTHPTTFGWMVPYIRAVAADDLRQVNTLILSAPYGAQFHLYGQPKPFTQNWSGTQILLYMDRQPS
jgi:hypothetical protein